MSRPVVTVILPVYNGARFVAEAVESVLAEAYAPVGILTIDDGSTDESAEILGRYEKVRVLRRENRGVAAAHNRAVAEGSGEVVNQSGQATSTAELLDVLNSRILQQRRKAVSP